MIKTVVLDTTLLTLLIVGLTDRKYISAHKRLSEFDEQDFDLLVSTLEAAQTLVVAPNMLTEASNWLRQINEPARSRIQVVFRIFIHEYREIYVESTEASDRDEFLRLGLTDSAVLEVAKDDILILSTDLDLCIAAEIAKYKFVNFNHLRDEQFDQTS
jgi:hypothetical protein